MLTLISAAAGCRIGAYGSSMRGRGTGSDASGTSDTSLSVPSAELTGDLMLKRFLVLTNVGAGPLTTRSRSPMGVLYEDASFVDVHFGGGLGFMPVQRERFMLSLFGLGTYRVTNDYSHAGAVYQAGAQFDLVVGGSDKGAVGASARIGIAHGGSAGVSIDNDGLGPSFLPMTFTAIMIQFGVFVLYVGER